MTIVWFHYPFVGLSGCQDRGGNGLTRTSLITHLRDRHCCSGAHDSTRHALSIVLSVFTTVEVTFARMGNWLCGVCFKTHSIRARCRPGRGDFVSPPDEGEGIVRFLLYDIPKPQVPSSPVQLGHDDGSLHDHSYGFDVTLLDRLFFKGFRTVKSIPSKCRLGFSRVLKGALDKVSSKPEYISCWVSLLVLPLCTPKTFCPRSNLECKSAIKRQHQEESISHAICSWGMQGGSLHLVRETLAEDSPNLSEGVEEDLDLDERNIKQCKRTICDGHYTAAVRVLS